jgi:hypothetical protein
VRSILSIPELLGCLALIAVGVGGGWLGGVLGWAITGGCIVSLVLLLAEAWDNRDRPSRGA